MSGQLLESIGGKAHGHTRLATAAKTATSVMGSRDPSTFWTSLYCCHILYHHQSSVCPLYRIGVRFLESGE